MSDIFFVTKVEKYMFILDGVKDNTYLALMLNDSMYHVHFLITARNLLWKCHIKQLIFFTSKVVYIQPHQTQPKSMA